MEHKFSDLKTFSVDEHHQREILSIPQPYWNHNSGIPASVLMVIYTFPLVMGEMQMIRMIIPKTLSLFLERFAYY